MQVDLAKAKNNGVVAGTVEQEYTIVDPSKQNTGTIQWSYVHSEDTRNRVTPTNNARI